MSDSVLLDMIKKKIGEIVDEQRGKAGDDGCKDLIAGLKKLLQDGVTDAVKAYREKTADRIAYGTAPGAFIIEQNPYAAWEDIDFPNLPLDPRGENPWVRRSGVLRDKNALDPLEEKEPIPGGIVVNFSYGGAPELEDRVPFRKPPGDVLPDPDKPAPDRTKFYPHNIVKAVRLRYTVLDRRYKPSSPFVQTEGGRDRQTGYILIMYSGNDSQ